MNIFILEDDFVQQAHLEKIIKEIRVQYNLHFKTVETFAKPVQLLESIYEIGLHNLFFLDIEIKNDEQIGLEVAKQIRQVDPYCSDCFCYNSFRINAFNLSLSGISFRLYR